MAGDWIKMRVDLLDDPAVFKLAEILNVDELHVVGSLFCFWSWADKHAVDGNVDGAATRMVDKVSMTPGFSDALVAVGWLKIDEKGIEIPHFKRHNGASAKERILKNARQARWRKGRDATVDANVGGAASTREEKRRYKTPHTPTGGEVALAKPKPATEAEGVGEVSPSPVRRKRASSPIVFATFLEICKQNTEAPIRDYRPLWAYAQKIGLNEDLIGLCWDEFCRRHSPGGVNADKRYTDWRAAFRKCAEGNWYRLWTVDAQGTICLTPQGRLAAKAAE